MIFCAGLIILLNWNYVVLHFVVAGKYLFFVLYFHQKCRRGPAKKALSMGEKFKIS